MYDIVMTLSRQHIGVLMSSSRCAMMKLEIFDTLHVGLFSDALQKSAIPTLSSLYRAPTIFLLAADLYTTMINR